MLRWQMPEDRPLVNQDHEDDVSTYQSEYTSPTGESELDQLETVTYWLKSDEKQVTRMSCVLLENVVRGLIHGGRYLYGLNGGEGAQAPVNAGMPDLDYLQECSINCCVTKQQQRSKGHDVAVTLKTTPDYAYLGYDEEELTRQPVTIGPLQSGPPADIWLIASPNWVLEMDPRQREAAVFNALLNIRPHEARYLNRWQAVAADLSGLNTATIEVYGPDISDTARMAVHAGARHGQQLMLPTLADEAKVALLETLAQEMGLQFTRDGRAVNPDGSERETEN